jgi:hypothetical protein
MCYRTNMLEFNIPFLYQFDTELLEIILRISAVPNIQIQINFS